ncbi:DUF2318 domain-containing protein [Candidatus Poribacteria bacterium]|nr:DUF2318 domain-containing protein [Candidatus Poribacteria bacterium]
MSQEKKYQSKHEKIVNKQQAKFPLWWVLLAATLGFVAIIIILSARQSNAPSQATEIAKQPKATDAQVDYRGADVQMFDIDAEVTNGNIVVELKQLEEKQFVGFKYTNWRPGGSEKSRALPLLAYITPSKKIVTAVSVCEPCRSTRFHISDDVLVCNSCGTRWTLDELKGISGGCLKYPPDIVTSTVKDGKIVIPESSVANWKPRV